MKGDQTTVKVHNFVKDYIQEMIDDFEKKGISFKSESEIIDIAVLRLHNEFENTDWKSQRSVNTLAEGMINDFLYLEQSKLVKVLMRNRPKFGDGKKRI
jgi:hypothetical protein